MRELSRWFARNRVDLAYVSMLKHDAYVVVGEGKRRNFPVVLRPEGAGATGDLAWQKWGRFGRSIGRRCRSADAFVAISPAVRGELEREGYDPARIFDLPNGVPVPEVPWQPPVATNSLRAAFVGRLAPEKGLTALVDAWPIVLQHRPEARLILIGEGPERPALETQIHQLGLANSVTLAGSTPDPSAILRQSDLFVLPSREEGMSIALLEAMALGIPAVVSDIPGNRALISQRIHGRLAPAADPLALAQTILDHRADPLSIMMAEAARARVVEHYSIAAVARRHLELFRVLVSASGADHGR
jgi:glycosyltransferase involved in cell wall biosynthesis